MSRSIVTRIVSSVGLVGLSLALLAAPARAVGADVVVTSLRLPPGIGDVQPGLGSMWALRADGYIFSTVFRIDPATTTVIGKFAVGYPAGDMTIAYGSIWVTDLYGSQLYRYSPNGRVQAVIAVGAQPQYVHAAFGSVWTSNHHGHSVSRIDPTTDGVSARMNVCADAFRNGPQEFTWDKSFLYLGCSNITRMQRIDPANNTVRNLADFGRLIDERDLRWAPGPLGGTLWNVSTHDLLGFTVLGSVRTQVPALPHNVIESETRFDGRLWYVQHSPGGSTSTVTGADLATGATLSSFTIERRAGLLRSGYGYLWALAFGGQLERIQVDATR